MGRSGTRRSFGKKQETRDWRSCLLAATACRGRTAPGPRCHRGRHRERGLPQGRSEPRASCPLEHRLWSARSWVGPWIWALGSSHDGGRQSQESGNFTGFRVTEDGGQQPGKLGRKRAGQGQPGDREKVVCHALRELVESLTKNHHGDVCDDF